MRWEKFCSTKMVAPTEPSSCSLDLDLTFPGQMLPIPKGQLYPAFYRKPSLNIFQMFSGLPKQPAGSPREHSSRTEQTCVFSPPHPHSPSLQPDTQVHSTHKTPPKCLAQSRHLAVLHRFLACILCTLNPCTKTGTLGSASQAGALFIKLLASPG